jgi:DinB superfamily
MKADKIFDDLENTLGEFSQLVSEFDDDSLNEIPFEGSWTAGQVAKHVILSDSGFIQLINGPVKDTGRAPDALAEDIKAIFLNFNIKMKSPEFIIPPAVTYKKTELLNALTDIKSGVNKSRGLEMDKTCTGRELPNMGFLTRFEAVSFMLYHTMRHLHQLKNVSVKVLGEGRNAD